MIRIRIDWEMISPFLRTITGILTVEEVDTSDYSKKPRTLIKCKVERKPGVIGYSAINDKGIPTDMFDKVIKPFVDVMIHSYYNGVILEKSDFHWIEENFVDNRIIEEWKKREKEKGLV